MIYLNGHSELGMGITNFFLTHLLLLWTLDQFFIVFINDILIYYRSREEYDQHLSINFRTFRQEKLCAKLSKSEFWLEIVLNIAA